MRLLSVQLLIASLAMPLCVIASEDPCNGIPEIQSFAPSLCECGKILSRHPIKAPKGMSLIAACRYKKVEFVGTVGDFFFKGDTTVNGVVKRINDPVIGDSVRFNAKASGKQIEFSNALASLKFEDNPDAIQKFKFPPLSVESPCWAANATIKVSRLHVHTGYESEGDGNYPNKYEIVKFGKYMPCPAEDESDDEEE